MTYRRPDELSVTLERLEEQRHPLDRLVVVDNGPSPETEAIVRRAADRASYPVEYVTNAENLGFTGGIATGMARVLEGAADEDWVVICDDDDPPSSRDAFAELGRFAEEMLERDPRTGGVGLGGGRFDFRRGRIVRVPTAELDGAVPLDYLAGNFFGCYRVAAIRDVGPFNPDIFFGFSEGEFGLRLRRAGYDLWGHGDIWRERRIAAGRGDHVARPSRRLGSTGWRRYYSLRNLIYILRQHGRGWTAVKVSFVAGVGKPLVNLPLAPRLAVRHLRWNTQAIRDGWVGRMGRRVEPVPWGPRPDDTAVRPARKRS